jgi:hypothetical protein
VKSKATTISGIWKALGHTSAISGGQGKKIRELVPNHLQLLEHNRGVVSTAEKTAQPVTQVAQPVAQAPEQVTATAKAPKTHAPKITIEKAKGPGGFRAGSHYAILFAEGSKTFADKSELITRVAKITGRSETLVKYDLDVMKYTKSKTNGGRARLEEKNGKIKIVPA